MKNSLFLMCVLLAGLFGVSSELTAEVNVYESMYSPNAKVVESGRNKVIVYDVLNVHFDAENAKTPELAGGFKPIFGSSLYKLPKFYEQPHTENLRAITKEFQIQWSIEEIELKQSHSIFKSIKDRYKLPDSKSEFEQSFAIHDYDPNNVSFNFRATKKLASSDQLITALENKTNWTNN